MIDARKASGLTQKQLAEKTSIAQADISKLENGNANLFAAHSPAFGRGHGHTYLAGICAQCVTYFYAQQYDKYKKLKENRPAEGYPAGRF